MKLIQLSRKLSTIVNISQKPQICIVGSGPAGFYAAQQLAHKYENAQIDIYERLPVPFGLVRYGVAPDHQDLKKCINTFTKIAKLPNVRYFGNISLGKDVSFELLKQAYHIVLLSYGVDDGRDVNIPGEKLPNVYKAKNFVGWYNGLPWEQHHKIDLSREEATIFGHGNVAIDVARLLLSPIDRLKTSDITENALEALSHSKIKQVTLIGRRGPLQVSFTTKELRELFNLPGICVKFKNLDIERLGDDIPKLVRPRKRLSELIFDCATKSINKTVSQHEKILNLVFLRSPIEIIGSARVESVLLGVNELVGNDLVNKTAKLTESSEVIASDLVISSVGYKSVRVDDKIPFDEARGVLRSENGRVLDSEGVYGAGWVARGPQGVLIDTMQHAFSIAALIGIDLEKGRLLKGTKPGFDGIKAVLEEKNLQIVGWKQWEKIDQVEREKGAALGKPREKIVNIDEMLRVAAL